MTFLQDKICQAGVRDVRFLWYRAQKIEEKKAIIYRKNSLTLSQHEVLNGELQVKATANMRVQTWFGNDKQLGHVSAIPRGQ